VVAGVLVWGRKRKKRGPITGVPEGAVKNKGCEGTRGSAGSKWGAT